MSSGLPHEQGQQRDEAEDEVFLDAADAEEEIPSDEDHPMGEDDEDEAMNFEEQEIAFQNDSAAHFDHHKDSLFCIAQHPIHPEIVLTGSGDDTAYIFDSSPEQTATDRPVLPKSYESDPQPTRERQSLPPLTKLDGHSDSVNAVAFTEPNGEYALTAGLDGKLRAYRDTTANGSGRMWDFVAEVQEVEEINWLAVCPVPSSEAEENKNVIALGANDGGVWVYRIDSSDAGQPIAMMQCFFQHTASCTAGAWTPDGKLLGTVSEDGSFYVYDVFGAAAAAGISSSTGTQAIIGLTVDDQRFAVEGGLYSITISPGGTLAAVGGAEGHIKVVGLPRLSGAPGSQTTNKSNSKSKSKASTAGTQAAVGQGGVGALLASLQAQSDGVETLSFSSPPLTLLAAGSVDGSIALFDVAHRFAVRRHIKAAHEEAAVVKVEFVRDLARPAGATSGAAPAASGAERSWLLTSAGMDGVVRRWDTRGGTAAAGYGLTKEWRGHMGVADMAGQEEEEAQSGGVLAFVQGGGGKRVVTAGDDGIALVFEE